MTTRTVGMDRHAAARRVMKAIAVGPRKVVLPFTSPDGSHPLVVTTPGEYLSAMIQRVDAVGGSANVALAEAKGFTVFSLVGQPEDTQPDEIVEEVNEDMSVGMFWLRHKAQQRRNRDVSYRLNSRETVVASNSQSFEYA